MPELAGPTARLLAAWLERLARQSDPTRMAELGKHSCTYRWVIEDGRVLDGIALRYGIEDDYVRQGGHIGYGIRSSARRRGLATWALGQMLAEACILGLDRMLAVCAVDNIASAKTLERCGGVFERTRVTRFGPVYRYWIDL